MAGFWHQSFQQLHDLNGKPYPGARAYFYAADSLSPIVVYQDYGLGTPHPNPVVADAYGVFPAVFLDEDDGFYRQRITTAGGVVIAGNDLPVLPVVGPGEGGGGAEVPVDPNALFKTGYPLWIPITGTLTGFVRLNGRSIGAALSGSSERANADCELLFTYNWTTYTDAYCPVSGGRGVSAAADWAANKTIGLLDMRNRSPFGLDDMGNTAASGFTGLTFTQGDATTAASRTGAARHTLTAAESAVLTYTSAVTDPEHDHDIPNTAANTGPFNTYANVGGTFGQIKSGSEATGITVATTANAGGGAHNNMPPAMLGTWYQRL